jgi:hypothetical protein
MRSAAAKVSASGLVEPPQPQLGMPSTIEISLTVLHAVHFAAARFPSESRPSTIHGPSRSNPASGSSSGGAAGFGFESRKRRAKCAA